MDKEITTPTVNIDLEIAQRAKIRHIKDIAANLGIPADDLEYYGKYKSKLPLKLIDERKIEQSNLILVSAINPTPAGEGKTTTSIGLCDGLNLIGKKAMVVLREPSLGPVFGMKGGAAGGGSASRPCLRFNPGSPGRGCEDMGRFQHGPVGGHVTARWAILWL